MIRFFEGYMAVWVPKIRLALNSSRLITCSRPSLNITISFKSFLILKLELLSNFFLFSLFSLNFSLVPNKVAGVLAVDEILIPSQLVTSLFTKQSNFVVWSVGHSFTQTVRYKVVGLGATK